MVANREMTLEYLIINQKKKTILLKLMHFDF